SLPGYSTAVQGGSEDFAYLIGTWTTRQRRLKATGSGSTEWDEAPPNWHCAEAYLGRSELVEESRSPNGTPAGLFLYGYNQAKRQWSIHWINPKTGDPDTGVVGGFTGARGEFYGPDEDGTGRPIKVRVTWTKLDRNHARWEQAFSYDDRTWETNWISDYTRVSIIGAGCRK